MCDVPFSAPRQPCPLDSSRLVSLSGSYGPTGVDMSTWYCPRCDVAFMLLSPARSATVSSVLQWHRRSGQLELREQDRQRWEELPRQFRDCWESNVRYHVRVFLGGRHLMERIVCHLDGTSIPVLHGWRGEAWTNWLLSWCVEWCKVGFLFASSTDYGWECCACVAWNAGLRQYEVLKEYPTGAGHAISPQLVAGLPPLTDYNLDDLRPKFAAALLPLADYTLDDLRRQLQMLRQQERQALPALLIKRFPWTANSAAAEFDRVERIIEAMAPEERRDPDGVGMPRRHAIARASATRLPEVCEFFTHFGAVREVMRRLGQYS